MDVCLVHRRNGNATWGQGTSLAASRPRHVGQLEARAAGQGPQPHNAPVPWAPAAGQREQGKAMPDRRGALTFVVPGWHLLCEKSEHHDRPLDDGNRRGKRKTKDSRKRTVFFETVIGRDGSAKASKDSEGRSKATRSEGDDLEDSAACALFGDARQRLDFASLVCTRSRVSNRK
jgi:hypothetical protein